MGRARERGLLLTALLVGLTGSALVAVVHGGTFDPQQADSLPRQAIVWAQLAVAAFGCHFVLARRGSDADETLLPVSMALTGVGLTVIYSLDPAQAQRQVTWLWLALGVLLLTVIRLVDVAKLREYVYVWGAGTAGLLLLPILFAKEVNGARLWIDLGVFKLQPSELAKLTLVMFLAAYLSSARGAAIAEADWRPLGLRLPSPRYLVPLLVMWVAAMVLLVALRDLGTALLFFGTFICVIYAATAQPGYLVFGAISFTCGAWAAAQMFGHVRNRIQAWLNPWPEEVLAKSGYQVAQGLFAIAAGGMGGVGLGMSQMVNPFTGRTVFAATTDLPFAALCEQMGLWGAALVVALYGFWVYRALRVSLSQPDNFRALLALGLGVLMAVQVFVIMGGVTKLIPLTGITLPFISYGGSSLISNFLMLGLLLRCSEGQR
ncbi:MAG: FtsW/RodA/SpoVE family cell cycle protein [Armatimonadetes bacterium]|nr:FtsW/RodA/SpoVE family cell cycle protein [Armatimonadota bacterium]